MRGTALVLPMKYTLGFSAAKDKGKRQHGNKERIKKQGIPKFSLSLCRTERHPF
jgi:hypothetical protein